MGKIDYYRNLAGFNILIVENGSFICDSLSDVFRSLDCTVVVTDTALSGLKCVSDDCFDIIISDMALPGKDGREFFKCVFPISPHSLKILIVGYGDMDPMITALDYGVDEIIEKPFPVTELLDRIVANFNEYHREQPKRSI